MTPAHGLREHHTSYQRGELRYLSGGDGPPLLLCHGFIGSAENFSDWFAALTPRRTVIAPDLPGFGASTPLCGPHTAMAMAGAALAAADAAGVADSASLDIAGLCLGASVALAAQRRRPDRVGRLVLHTPLLQPRLVRRRFHAQVAVMLAPGVYPGIVWLSRQRRVSDLYKRLMVEGSDVDPEAALVNFDNQRRADVRATREWLRDGLRRDDLEQVRTGGTPTLIMVAADDRIVNVDGAQRALDGAPHVQLAVLHGGGHAWTTEMVEAQRGLLAAFLDGEPLPRPGVISAAA
jgi:pimeloyl-ACP methyl ester carboxylesterase